MLRTIIYRPSMRRGTIQHKLRIELRTKKDTHTSPSWRVMRVHLEKTDRERAHCILHVCFEHMNRARTHIDRLYRHCRAGRVSKDYATVPVYGVHVTS